MNDKQLINQLAEEIKSATPNKIDDILLKCSENKINPAILAQTVSKDEELQKLAYEYHISVGRVALIQRILTKDTTKNFEDLVTLSINDLYLLADSKDIDFDDLLSKGNPSEDGYIGVSKVKSIAFSHANVQSAQASDVQVKLDFDDGVMIYEIEFISDGMKYEYDIDATTGNIIKSEKDALNHDDNDDDKDKDNDKDYDDDDNIPANTSRFITKEKAKSIAFSRAGISSAKNLSISLDRDDATYDVEFDANGYQYDFEINAVSGKVLDVDRDKIEVSQNKQNTENENDSDQDKDDDKEQENDDTDDDEDQDDDDDEDEEDDN